MYFQATNGTKQNCNLCVQKAQSDWRRQLI